MKNNEEYFLEEFNKDFKEGIEDFALVKGELVEFIIVNIKRESMLLLENKEMADFFAKRLLMMGAKVYKDSKDIPGWGTKERERPPDIETFLKQFRKKE